MNPKLKWALWIIGLIIVFAPTLGVTLFGLAGDLFNTIIDSLTIFGNGVAKQ